MVGSEPSPDQWLHIVLYWEIGQRALFGLQTQRSVCDIDGGTGGLDLGLE